MADLASTRPDTPPNAAELFTPKLVTVFREGYHLADLRADLVSGLTVAIVALPLSMAIAIASGVTPERGLFTAAVGGLLISALGGSRFQIGGPAAAFTVLVASTVARHGLPGLALATILAGILLLGMGLLRLGSYIKFIPYPVTVGFISGIAVILFIGQISDLAGLKLASNPADILPKLAALAAAAGTITWPAIAIGIGTVVVMVLMRRYLPRWPGILIAVVLAALAVFALGLPIETIGTRFGGIPSTLPAPSLPPISVQSVLDVLPDAISFALLGAIESLLSAMVADNMTGRRHRSNMELVAQGIANIGSALFGGITATGTVARTATNVRSGARSPLSGVFHAGFILLFMLVAAPLARFIPLASLAGVLAVVSWNMVEKPAIAALVRGSRGDALVLAVTFLLTVFVGLTAAIVAGFALGSLLFIRRMAQAASVELHVPQVEEDVADDPRRAPYDPSEGGDPDIAIYRISGAFFFGAAASVGVVLDRIADRHKVLILDFAAVPFIDSTAASTIESIARKASRQGVRLFVSGASAATLQMLAAHHVGAPAIAVEPSLQSATQAARRSLAA